MGNPSAGRAGPDLAPIPPAAAFPGRTTVEIWSQGANGTRSGPMPFIEWLMRHRVGFVGIPVVLLALVPAQAQVKGGAFEPARGVFAPLSLTASDGAGLQLVRFEAR